ncbi:MAG: hypothetical protein LBI79_09545 [Nitrososphaerota archaeon]|nr:hypothetical protein [Nitrososphaerota archaeon]
MEITKMEQQVLLTRDLELYKRTIKESGCVLCERQNRAEAACRSYKTLWTG